MSSPFLRILTSQHGFRVVEVDAYYSQPSCLVTGIGGKGNGWLVMV